MPKNLTLLGLLIVCMSIIAAGAYVFDAPVIITKAFAVTSAILTAAEKLGVGK